MSKQAKVYPSEFLKTFLDFVSNAKSDYQYNLEAMKNEECITQDYLHMLELENLTYHERGKIASQLAANRKKRRSYKDSVEELEPIVNFFDDPLNKKMIDHMIQLLGQVRKVENYHQKRFYIPKAAHNSEDKTDPEYKSLADVS